MLKVATKSGLENRVFTLETVGHEKIIGEQEACELLRKGKSFYSENLDHMSAVISVSRPELDWLTDTKGFFQPVYRFILTDKNNGRQFTDYVPALK